MIISKDTNPERDVYYLGARVIEAMDTIEGNELDFLDVYQALNKREALSVSLFALTLDWLFVVGAINKTTRGNIQKCF